VAAGLDREWRGKPVGVRALALVSLGSALVALSTFHLSALKRVFAIEIETCQRCGGSLEVIASIEDPELIGRILPAAQMPIRVPGLIFYPPS
jgi:hypothetical protein